MVRASTNCRNTASPPRPSRSPPCHTHSKGHPTDAIRDEAISGDGRYLYAIHPDAQKLFGWAVGQRGQLTQVGEFGGVPGTVAGLAAS